MKFVNLMSKFLSVFGFLLMLNANGWADSSDNPNISLACTPSSPYEGNTSTTTVTCTVSIDEAPNKSSLNLKISTTDGTATTADGDYNALSTNFNFAQNTSTLSQQFTVTINGDTKYESDETFTVSVTDNGTSASQSKTLPSSQTITIKNDDQFLAAVNTYGSSSSIKIGDYGYITTPYYQLPTDSVILGNVVDNANNSCQYSSYGSHDCTANSHYIFTSGFQTKTFTTPTKPSSIASGSGTAQLSSNTSTYIQSPTNYNDLKISNGAKVTLNLDSYNVDGTKPFKVSTLELWDTGTSLYLTQNTPYAVASSTAINVNSSTSLVMSNASSLTAKDVSIGSNGSFMLPQVSDINITGTWTNNGGGCSEIDGSNAHYNFFDDIKDVSGGSFYINGASQFYAKSLTASNIYLNVDTINISSDLKLDTTTGKNPTLVITPNSSSNASVIINGTADFGSNNANSQVCLAGGDYYFNNLTVGSSVHIDPIPNTGTVRIYVNGTFTDGSSGQGAYYNQGGDPSKMLLYSKGNMVINGNASDSGLFISDGNINIYSGSSYISKINGAMLANNTIDFYSSSSYAQITYDPNVNAISGVSGFGGTTDTNLNPSGSAYSTSGRCDFALSTPTCGFSAPPTQCGIFPNPLTTYDVLTVSGSGNSNHSEVCDSANISYLATGSNIGTLSCYATGCTGTSNCTNVAPPSTKYSVTFPTLSSTTTTLGSTQTLSPTQTYAGAASSGYSTYGNTTISGNGTTITFSAGDYYFNSLTLSSNDINLKITGNVRIFIKGDLTSSANNLLINSTGTPDKLMIYAGGNFNFTGSGGGSGALKAYFYIKGNTTINPNSNNGFDLTGGITSEGFITLNGNNINLNQYTHGAGYDYGTCGGSYNPFYGIFDAWESTISDATPPALSSRYIQTKIVKKATTLHVGSVDESIYTPTTGLVGWRLVDTSTQACSATSDNNITGWTDVDLTSNGGPVTINLTPTQAIKNVRIQFATKSGSTYSSSDRNCSSDNFAIRPDKFVLSSTDTSYPNLLKAGKTYNYKIQAYDATSALATTYSVTNAQNEINATTSPLRYFKDNTLDTSGNLNGTFTTATTAYNMTNGISVDASSNNVVAGFSYSDVGKVTLEVKDLNWSQVDIDNAIDQTPRDCTGAYICGDLNITVIPDHFHFSNLQVVDNNGSTGYTYLANLQDQNSTSYSMAGRVSGTIQAMDANGNITKNFRTGSLYYENPVQVTMKVHDTTAGDGNTTSIPTALIGFGLSNGDVNGTRSILWNETNATALRFNYPRAVNVAQNPFNIPGSDLNVTLSSTYTDASTPIATATITDDSSGIATAGQSVTFIYGRTHAPRYRYSEPTTRDAPIYYEMYCNASGNKALLPTGYIGSSDSVGWYLNKQHTVSDGNVTQLQEKGATKVTTSSTVPFSITNGISTAVLNYKANGTNTNDNTYPYRTTMQATPSSWLIYNPYNASATSNDFDVEFYGSSATWTGQKSNSTTTDSNANVTTNKRILW